MPPALRPTARVATVLAFVATVQDSIPENHEVQRWFRSEVYSRKGAGKMNAISKISDTDRYARCVEASKRVRWDIDEDAIRGRGFDAANKFLPYGLSLADGFTTLSNDEMRFVSQIQGRT